MFGTHRPGVTHGVGRYIAVGCTGLAGWGGGPAAGSRRPAGKGTSGQTRRGNKRGAGAVISHSTQQWQIGVVLVPCQPRLRCRRYLGGSGERRVSLSVLARSI
jgi:hypothetical protein